MNACIICNIAKRGGNQPQEKQIENIHRISEASPKIFDSIDIPNTNAKRQNAKDSIKKDFARDCEGVFAFAMQKEPF